MLETFKVKLEDLKTESSRVVLPINESYYTVSAEKKRKGWIKEVVRNRKVNR